MGCIPPTLSYTPVLVLTRSYDCSVRVYILNQGFPYTAEEWCCTTLLYSFAVVSEATENIRSL